MATADTAAAVSKIANVIVPVSDQDKQVAFYTEKLGLEKRADIPFDGADGRWVEVAPSGADTPIALCPPGPNGTAGGQQTGITLQTDDIEAYRAQLAERGVDVDAEVSRMGDPVPPLFFFRDAEDNTLLVVEAN
jgi:catechol 2,3-dioxygenase-like lactoylglutathione lyase family enzyme